MAEELVLYSNPQSRGTIAQWMLEEVGVPYRLEVLEYGEAMKTPDYLAINPMGKVPALRHGQTVVTEGAAICAYLADAFPDAGLAPAPGDRGAYYRWLFFSAGPAEAAITNKMLGTEVSEEQEKMVGYGTYDLVVSTLEQAVSTGNYVAGPTFTAADVYVGAQIGWGMRFKTLPPRPAFERYWTRLADRPACKKIMAYESEAAQSR